MKPTFMSRAFASPGMSSLFVSLVVRTDAKGNEIWVRCKRETAEFYGWTQTYAEQDTQERFNAEGELIRSGIPRKANYKTGGIPIRIGRHPNKRREVGGMTNRLRIHSHFTVADQAELAHFTKVPWEWMARPNGQRWTKDEWEWVYENGKTTSQPLGPIGY